ncbi:MAG: DUF4252 domain-containing protein [Cloacibacterium sp.]|jgi:predicted CopG family antitoxin|nr:DUF4252 domain-containing protein [Cloacibacterium sp.]
MRNIAQYHSFSFLALSRKLFIMLLLGFLSTGVFGQTEKLDKIFEKYQETEGVTSIKIAKPMFRLLNSMKIDNADLQTIQPIISKMNGLKILIIDNNEMSNKGTKSSVDNRKIQQEIFGAVKSLNFEELMTINNKQNKIQFLAENTQSDILDNLLLSINSDESNILMILDGKISMEDVSKLINETQNAVKDKPKTTITTENYSSDGVQQIRNVGDFTGIATSTGVAVTYEQGNQQSVRVETDPGKEQYIITKVENGILKIYVDNLGQRNMRFGKMQVYVVSPQLTSLKMESGSAFKTTNQVKGKSLVINMDSGSACKADFDISGETKINMDSGSALKIQLNTTDLNFNGDSGMAATISGKAESAKFNIDSGASCNAADFEAKNVVAKVSSGAIMKVWATDDLNVSVSSAASVRYRGNPKNITSNVSKITGAQLKKID